MKKFLWFVSIVSLLYGIGFNQYLLFDLFGIEYQRDPNGSEVMVAFYFGCPALILSLLRQRWHSEEGSGVIKTSCSIFHRFS